MRLSSALLITAATTVASVGAFAPPTLNVRKVALQHPSTTAVFASPQEEEEKAAEDVVSFDHLVQGATTSLTVWAATSSSAMAAGPDWGIFEGRTGSLLHPLTMGSLLLFSLYTGFLGLQWRRQRTLGDEISSLKKQLPDLGGASSLTEALASAKAAEEPSSTRVYELEKALPLSKEIEGLVQERKDLVAAGPRDKHFSQGALLAFLGTAFAIEGPLNTYARAGKLFPGPHLYAGAGLVVLWALAAACVPSMQKGSDTARSIHIAANTAGIGLFGWQVVSGIPILLKVVEKTSWP